MVRRVVEVFGKFWQSGGFDHPSDPDLITCCRPLTSRVRIPHAVLIAASLMVKHRYFLTCNGGSNPSRRHSSHSVVVYHVGL